MTSPAAAITNESGRVYPIPDPQTGEMHMLPSNSTVCKALDQVGLNIWKQKKVARVVATDPDIAATARIDEWAAIKAAIGKVEDDGPSATALGDMVHGWSEVVDLEGRSEPGPVPDFVGPHADLVRPYIECWLEAKQVFGIEIVAVERTVFNIAGGYAGTLDRLLSFRDPAAVAAAFEEKFRRPIDVTGVLVGDIKSGKAVYPEHCLQLSGYANAEAFWDPDNVESSPLPEALRTDLAVAIHLGPHSWDLIPLDLVDAYPAFLAVVRAWNWANRDSKTAIGRPLPIPELPELATEGDLW